MSYYFCVNIGNKKNGRFYPNFRVFIRKLKQEKMSKANNGDIPRKAKKDRRKRKQIAALKQSYASRNRNIENYWKTLKR